MPPSVNYGAPTIPQHSRNLANQGGSAAGANSRALPDKIKCNGCKKDRPQTDYSKTQLRNFSSTISNKYAPKGRTTKPVKITCKSCTNTQVEELTCILCDKVKGIDSFAKNRRSPPDQAKCKMCMAKTVEIEADVPIASDGEYAESDSGSDWGDSSASKAIKKGPAPKSASSQYATPSNGFTQASTGYQTPAEVDGGAQDDDGWVTVPSTTKRNGSSRASSYAASARSSNQNTGTNTPSSRGGVPIRKNGWAKVEKVKKGEEKPWADEFSGYAPGGNPNPYRKSNASKTDDFEDDW